VVIPSVQKLVLMLFQVPDDSAEFTLCVSEVHDNREVIQPDLRFAIVRANVHVRWFAALV
jgi:hypothetical protein